MTEILPPTPGSTAPHDGIWIKTEEYFVEISIFETGVPPRFRLYFFDPAGKTIPIPPGDTVEIETVRPDGARQCFSFQGKANYLEATDELSEPHEFEATLRLGNHSSSRSYIVAFREQRHGHDEHDQGGHSHDHGDHDEGHKHRDHGGGIFGWLTGKFAHSHSIAERTDTALKSNEKGIRTLKISLAILAITATFQVIIVLISGSVALLADTIHNFADAGTSFPLWIAFALARRGANRRYTYGYGKVEDLAGVLIVLIIFSSACIAGFESLMKLLHPSPMTNMGWVVAAAIIGFIGNEWVAMYRIRVGKEIGSAALVADGHHARVDGFTSLAVLFGVVGVWVGMPIIDPLVGMGITLAILFIVKDAARSVWVRLTDGIEPAILLQIEHAPMHVAGVKAVHDVRARWLGHRVHTDVAVDVDPALTVVEADAVAQGVERSLKDHVRLLDSAVVRVRPG